ncbi:MAG TPA: SDR family oxidoreductase [Candidatus Acidoferrales bacterium]|nr:SDR family oxidoreductase [Candidatus Acidoferrales bacterium]
MNYLVTGGAGFIGSHIVDKLLEKGNKVRVLDNFSTGRKENLAYSLDKVELIEGDVRDYQVVREAAEGIDVVLHQAAISSVVKSVDDPVTTNAVNVDGTVNILQASRDASVKRVVYASSASVYGNNPDVPKRETMMPSPESPYAVSKLTGEYYCKVFSSLFGLHTVCLRYFNVFGERQDPSSEYSGVISRFISALLSDRNPTIYGDGEQSRDFVYVRNVVDANILAGTIDCRPGPVLNVGCSARTTLNQLVKELNSIIGKNLTPIYQPPRAGDVRNSLADITLIEKVLCYEPKIGFRQGLEKTIDGHLRLRNPLV